MLARAEVYHQCAWNVKKPRWSSKSHDGHQKATVAVKILELWLSTRKSVGRRGGPQSTAARHKGRRFGAPFFVLTLPFLFSVLPRPLYILLSLPSLPPRALHSRVQFSSLGRPHVLHPCRGGRGVRSLESPAPSLSGLGGSKQSASNGEAVLESYGV